MIRFVHTVGCWLLTLGLIACGGAAPGQVREALDVVEAVNAENTAGFARVTAPRPFVFPQDHGPHPEYQTEWWYYTGNVQDATGRHFGYQLTFFRRGLRPDAVQRDSAWATNSIYMAHLALSDVASGRFYHFERFSREGAGLAGATGVPFRVFLEDWSVDGSGPEGMTMHLRAAQEGVALDLTLASTKPPTLQGDRGLSQKGAEAGQATYYYSLTRMATTGSVSINGQTYTVQGLSWLDREFGTGFLDATAAGWDWFSVQLADGRDLMFAQIRYTDGRTSPFFGTLIAADGSTRLLNPATASLESLATWNSPHSGGVYPAAWRLHLPDEGLTLELTPLLADQELTGVVVYWEGAVRVMGTQAGQPVSGYGYVELTGYAEGYHGRY